MRGLNRQKVRDGEASMLYKIDREKNQSKYYEILITQNSQNKGGYTLTKRWGRLGPRFQERTEDFKNLAGAKAELQRIELSKVKRGYISAFGDYHRSPNGKNFHKVNIHLVLRVMQVLGQTKTSTLVSPHSSN